MATIRIDNRKDILLLLLYSPGIGQAVNEPITGRTRLMKMLFLFRKEALGKFRHNVSVDESNFYDFFPWDFGPFSKDVYDDITFFVLRGFIQAQAVEEEGLPEAAEEWRSWVVWSGVDFGSEEAEDYQVEEFRLSNKGEKFAAALYADLSDTQKRLLKEFKARLVKTPLRAILRYVYSEYPDYTQKSKIKEQVIGR